MAYYLNINCWFYYLYDYYFFICKTRITSLSDDGSFSKIFEPFLSFAEINFMLLGKGFGVVELIFLNSQLSYQF